VGLPSWVERSSHSVWHDVAAVGSAGEDWMHMVVDGAGHKARASVSLDLQGLEGTCPGHDQAACRPFVGQDGLAENLGDSSSALVVDYRNH